MRPFFLITAAAGLAACSPSVPDSGQGAGLGAPASYQAPQGASVAQSPADSLPPPAAISAAPLDGGQAVAAAPATPVIDPPLDATGDDGSSDLVADARAALGGDEDALANEGEGTDTGALILPPDGTADATVGEDDSVSVEEAAPALDGADPVAGAGAAPEADATVTPGPEAVASSGISQENDFDAVGAQRSIEGDAARIAQNRAQYKVVEAEALPQRTDAGGPNIVEYALATQHPPGTQVYRRIGINLENRSNRNCDKYASADQAQADFLERGGPERDRLALDPDGDGFACAWDPRPFRKAVGN